MQRYLFHLTKKYLHIYEDTIGAKNQMIAPLISYLVQAFFWTLL